MTSAGRGLSSALTASSISLITALPVFLFSVTYLFIGAEAPMSAIEFGGAVASFWLAAAVTSAPVSLLVGWFGTRNCLALAAGTSAVVMLLIAMLPVERWFWYAVLLGLGGVANALAHPASNALIVTEVSPRMAATAFGLKQAAIPGAVMLAGFALPTLTSVAGWRVVFAAMGVVAALGVLRLVGRPDRSGSLRAEPLVKRARRPSQNRLRLIRMITWASALGTGQANAVAAFSAVLAIGAGFSEAQGGTIIGIAGVAGILARLTAGYLADRGMGGTFVSVAVMLLLGGIGALALSIQAGPFFLVGIVAAYSLGWGWNGLAHFLVSNLDGDSARATGRVQAGAYLGCAMGPVCFGLLAESFSLSAAVLACACAAFLASALAALIARRLKDPGLPG